MVQDGLFFAPKLYVCTAGIIVEVPPVADAAKNYGVPEKLTGFLGKRKHNGEVSFFARKTMSEVCADEAQRSKFIGASSRNEFWEPQEGSEKRAKEC